MDALPVNPAVLFLIKESCWPHPGGGICHRDGRAVFLYVEMAWRREADPCVAVVRRWDILMLFTAVVGADAADRLSAEEYVGVLWNRHDRNVCSPTIHSGEKHGLFSIPFVLFFDKEQGNADRGSDRDHSITGGR